jgi:TRAP-type mannitol/chloroaromatic compound transport system substrate-binding protein
MGGWFKREIRSLDDLKGLKMRIPGLGGKVMDALGVSVQVLAGGEIYQALELGTIDATEWVGPYDDEKLGFHQIAKNYYYPGWWEPGPALSFLVNRAAWDDLPGTYQEVFDAATRQAGLAMQARYDAKNPPALARILNSDVTIRPFSTEIMDGARLAAEQLLDAHAAADPAYRVLYDDWVRFRDDQYRWFAVAELEYGEYAFRRV